MPIHKSAKSEQSRQAASSIKATNFSVDHEDRTILKRGDSRPTWISGAGGGEFESLWQQIDGLDTCIIKHWPYTDDGGI